MGNRVLDEFLQDAGLCASAPGDGTAGSPAAGLLAAPAVEFEAGCFDSGPGAALPSTLPVMELASGAGAAAGYAAAALAGLRQSEAARSVRVDPASVAASFRGERLMRLDGRTERSFGELSGFFRARDGWVRTHANYPHHRERLLRALDLSPDAGRREVASRIQRLGTADIETGVRAAGGVAAAVRTDEQWRCSDEYAALTAKPMTSIRALGDAPRRLLSTATRPASGLRVLDLTRVIAGPVAGRTLAWLGAEVLRIDPPALPELPGQHLATGAGKRSALLDLGDPEDRCRFDHLLGEADVVLLGYRTEALARLSLRPGELAARHPGLIIGRLTAWGDEGLRAGARGFDSIVQAASGIAVRESVGREPGVLPAQALDHASGYLLAAGVLAAVVRQLSDGGSWQVECTLARTASWLLDSAPTRIADAGDWDLTGRMMGVDTPSGHLELARPVVRIDGVSDEFTGCGRPWGVDPPRWADDE